MQPRVCLIVIRATDLTRSEAFYRALGLEFSREQHSRGPVHLAADVDGVVFEIYPLGSQPATVGTRLGLRVADVEACTAAAETAGGRIQEPPADGPWGRRAVVRDPDGHAVELLESPRPTA
jgi:lactoylglutathione lyase